MYKLITIDIDGTLINDQYEISEKTIEVINEAKQQGIHIVLCSGRPIGGMKNYIETLGLNRVGDYAIAYNGALVQDTHTTESVIEFSLTLDHLQQLYDLSISLNSPMHYFTGKGVYTPNKDISQYTVYEAFINNIPLHYQEINEVATDIALSKIMFIDHPENLKETIQQIPEELHEQYTIVQSAPHFLEFVHPTTSKGFAVQKLAEKLGIKQEEIMSIGDNGNDISMIEYAGCGVAMGNAVPDVKAVADFETLTNNENGVAHAIETLILHPLKEK